MTRSTTSFQRFIGCDVGKATIVVFDSRDGSLASLANSPAALAAFASSLDAGSLVVCEATGGYESALLEALSQAGRPAHRADARKVKAFIRSFGTLGKTDAIDARALARYGEERHPQLALWVPRDKAREALQNLVLARQDLVQLRVDLQNRLAAPGVTETVRGSLQRLLDALKAEIATIEAHSAELVGAHAELAHQTQVLQSIAGIGAISAKSLLALMPELGTLERRQAAALAGLAPHPRQSGTSDAPRHTRGGRPELKRVLFMAALAASRHNPALKAFYQRLRGNGKKPLSLPPTRSGVALTALMRKLIVIANAKLRSLLAATPPAAQSN